MIEINLSMKQITHRHREQICGCQGTGMGEMDGLGAWD